MNDLETEQYERIARSLDGSDEALSARERRVADEIRHLETALRGALDTRVPAVVLSRARSRLAEAARRRRRVVRFRLFSGVAAAAGLLLAVAMAYWARGLNSDRTSRPGARVANGPSGGAAGDAWTPAVTSALETADRNADLLMLAREMNELEASTVAAVPSADAELDALERDFGSFMANGEIVLPPGL
jgi:hypothetical protein